MLITFPPRVWHGNCTAFTAAGHPGTATSRAVAGGRSRTPARGAVALPGRSLRSQRTAEMGKGQQGKTVARGLVPRGCRQIQRARASLRRDPPSPEASAWQARRRGRQGDGKAAFATCSLKPHASSLPLCGEKQEGGRVRELGNRSPETGKRGRKRGPEMPVAGNHLLSQAN